MMDSSHVRLKFDIKLKGQNLEQIRKKHNTYQVARRERELYGERVRVGERGRERGEREGGRRREREGVGEREGEGGEREERNRRERRGWE